MFGTADEYAKRLTVEFDGSLDILSCLHNLCRFGEANEWSNEPPEPGWASPLTVSGLTDVGRGERLLGAIAACAAVTYFIRWCGGCQRFLAANRWIGNRHAVTTVLRGTLVATSQHAGQLVARRCRNQELLPQRSLRLPSSPRAVAGANCVHDRPVATCPINHFPDRQLAI